MAIIHFTKENWLSDAVLELENEFKLEGLRMPAKWRISSGFPSKGGLAAKKRTIGQCWSPEASKDGTTEIIISITQDDETKILGVIAHEMCHAILGIKAGHGPKFKKLANSNGLLSYIVFVGYLPGSSFNIIKQLDLLLSMTQDFEGFGLTIAEAMIVKTSVIATDVGAVSEFFNNSVGDLVPSKSPQIVAEKIIQYLDNPNSFLEKKENAEKIIKNQFNAKLMSENFRKILHKSSNQSLI